MSDVVEVESSFTWKIENYSFCFDKLGETLKSPIFTANNLNGSSWFLTFRLYEENDRCNAACYLNRCKDELYSDGIYVTFTIDTIDGNGYSINSKKSYQTYYPWSRDGWEMFNKTEVRRGTHYATYQNSKWKKDILTINCQIKSNLRHSKSVAITEIGVDKCSFQWNLKLSDCVAASQKKNFSLSKDLQYEISVSASGDLIEIKIKAEKECIASQQFLHGKLILLNQEAAEVSSENAKHSFNLEDDNAIWNFPPFISKEQLSSCLSNDIFSLLCEFSVINGKDSSGISSSATSFRINYNNAQTLREDLTSLFTTSKHSDVELRSGSTTFLVHKSLLAARSPVFSVMFDQDMIEKHSGIVDISDIDPETLENFLAFVYTGDVDIENYESASKLLMIAEKYQMPSLKETCLVFIMSDISTKNLFLVLDLAEIFDLRQLKKCALDFFAEHMKEITVLPQWKTFSKKNAELSMEIISHVAENFEISTKKK